MQFGGGKTTWSEEEDQRLTELVGEFGAKRWSAIANQIGTRSGKQCRERWRNQLDPSINKAAFSAEEDRKILELVDQLGTKWSAIAHHLPGRTDNAVKNRFHSSLRGLHGKKPKKPKRSPFATPSAHRKRRHSQSSSASRASSRSPAHPPRATPSPLPSDVPTTPTMVPATCPRQLRPRRRCNSRPFLDADSDGEGEGEGGENCVNASSGRSRVGGLEWRGLGTPLDCLPPLAAILGEMDGPSAGGGGHGSVGVGGGGDDDDDGGGGDEEALASLEVNAAHVLCHLRDDVVA